MPAAPKFRRDELRRISWSEYGRTLEILYAKIGRYLKESGTAVDAVIPILRGGAVPGAYLAYKLKLLTILPVQYKYLYSKGKGDLRRLSNLDVSPLRGIRRPVLLLVENNHFSGATAKAAVKDLRRALPNARIIYAAARADYTNRKLEGVSAQFYGKLMNETRGLTQKEARSKGIANWIAVFPWENFEEELSGMNSKGFGYNGLDLVKKHSKSVDG